MRKLFDVFLKSIATSVQQQHVNTSPKMSANSDLNTFIQNWSGKSCKRDDFVKEALNHLSDLGYNVFICHPDHRCNGHDACGRVVILANDFYGLPVPFNIYIARGAMKAKNRGDGGWINWGMSGDFDRNGKTVTFK
ncbi:hypothetical protein GGF32_007705 [Allomyces javanicus]|nr:hypothetical protein GGF32_007705 [Allomyces javanicus]